MFMAMNYYQEKEKLKYSVFSISGFFSFILYRTLCIKEVNIALK